MGLTRKALQLRQVGATETIWRGTVALGPNTARANYRQCARVPDCGPDWHGSPAGWRRAASHRVSGVARQSGVRDLICAFSLALEHYRLLIAFRLMAGRNGPC